MAGPHPQARARGCAPGTDSEPSFPVTQAPPRAWDWEPGVAPGRSAGGGPGSAGQLGLRRGRGQGGRGQRPSARREGRVAAGRWGGPPPQRGPGIPTKAFEEVMGRSLGSRGPGARGSSPHCAAAVRCPVPGGLSEAPGPAAPAPPPSALPRRGPAPPRPPVPLAGRGARATPCASAGLQKLWAPYPTAGLISGLARSSLLGAEKEAGTGLEARTKRQR